MTDARHELSSLSEALIAPANISVSSSTSHLDTKSRISRTVVALCLFNLPRKHGRRVLRVFNSLDLSPLPCVPIHFLPSVGVNNNDIQLALSNYLLTQQGPALIGSSKVCTSVARVCVCDGNVKCHDEGAPLLLSSQAFREKAGTTRRGFQSAPICFHVGCCLLTLTGMCLLVDYYQLCIPSGPGRATVFVRCSEAGLSAQPARCCISHCPTSNEFQRANSLTRLLLPPNHQMKRRPLP